MQKKLRAEKNGNDYELPKKVGIIYSDVRKEFFPTEVQYITEKDADADAQLIGDYLSTLGITVTLYVGNKDLSILLQTNQPEMVINIVDSVNGDETLSSAIPGVLELLNIPYTGADILGLSLDTNKFLIKDTAPANWYSNPELSID